MYHRPTIGYPGLKENKRQKKAKTSAATALSPIHYPKPFQKSLEPAAYQHNVDKSASGGSRARVLDLCVRGEEGDVMSF